MVMCGVLLKDKKRSVDLYSLLGVESVAEVVSRGRFRFFGHVESKSGDDWCRPVGMWWWQGCDVPVGAGRLGENV